MKGNWVRKGAKSRGLGEEKVSVEVVQGWERLEVRQGEARGGSRVVRGENEWRG